MNCFLLFPVRMKIICRNQYSTRERNRAQELDGVSAIYSRYEQNTSKKQHKCVVLHKVYSPYAYLQGVRRTDGRTHARTENIYSIFRDKLLLLGEHGQKLEIKGQEYELDSTSRVQITHILGGGSARSQLLISHIKLNHVSGTARLSSWART